MPGQSYLDEPLVRVVSYALRTSDDVEAWHARSLEQTAGRPLADVAVPGTSFAVRDVAYADSGIAELGCGRLIVRITAERFAPSAEAMDELVRRAAARVCDSRQS